MMKSGLLAEGENKMYIAANMMDAVKVAALLNEDWLFVESGEAYNKDELMLLAEAFDKTTPLADKDYFLITEDGSLGIMYDGVPKPDWHFVSPGFAAAEILNMTPEEFAAAVAGTKKSKFCGNCGAPLKPGSKFCGNCGAKNS